MNISEIADSTFFESVGFKFIDVDHMRLRSSPGGFWIDATGDVTLCEKNNISLSIGWRCDHSPSHGFNCTFADNPTQLQVITLLNALGFLPPAVAAVFADDEAEQLRTAIRKHRDQRGDDRCWMDDEELYRILPEGFTPPVRDSAVELARCQQFIACRHNPGTAYVSTQRRIEELEAEVARLSALMHPPTLPDLIAGRPYKITHSEKFGFWVIVEICDEDCPCSLTKSGEWSPVLNDTWPTREAAEDFIRSLH